MPHLDGNFLKDRIQCLGFGYPKGRLHDFAVTFVRVTFTVQSLVSHRKSEENSSYLPWLKHRYRLSKRQTPPNQVKDQENSGHAQINLANSRRSAGLGYL